MFVVDIVALRLNLSQFIRFLPDSIFSTNYHTRCIPSSQSRCLSYDRSTDNSKASSPCSAIQCFLLQLPASSHFFKFNQQLLMSSSSSSPFFCLFLNEVFQKTVRTQDMNNPVSLPSVYCLQDVPSLIDSVHYFFFHTIYPTDLLKPSLAQHFKTFMI